MTLRTAPEVIALGHMDDVYLYHQRFGTILQMSPDVHALWAAFGDGRAAADVANEFRARLEGPRPEDLIQTFAEFHCLLAPDDDNDAWLDAVPVKGAWNVWERDGDDVVLWTAWGDREVSQHRLTGVEVALWDAIDGETSNARLAQARGVDAVDALVARLAAIEVQAIKLSPVPLSVYGGRHKWPPYLTSTMPYPPLADAAPTPGLADYHRDIADADVQFDHLETTLAHLFRRPHPALGDRTYGAALLAGLERRGLTLPDRPLRVLEVGGGLGEVAASFVDAARERGFAVDYTICELSQTLAARQRERTAAQGVRVVVADGLALEWPAGEVDLFIANEMIGDLPTTPLPDAGAWVERAALDVDGAPAGTVVNTGAFELLERVGTWLAPGGLGVLTEFGDKSAWPRLSTHLDHPETSIHFGHLESVAGELGLEAEFLFLMDLIDMRRDLQGLATTRSQLRALAAMLAARGVTLEKIGYTAEMFAALTADIEPGTIGDLRFDRIEDRLMGLVPHEFKALIVRRAQASG